MDDDITDPTDSTTWQPEEEPAPDPWARMNRAAQELADSVQALPSVTPAITIPPIQLPRIPRLQLTYDDPPAPPDQRHLTVSVRTVPVYGSAEIHMFHDPAGLQWQTYGADSTDFSTDRMLEVQDQDGEPIASYPAGTWLDVCYPAYRNADPVRTDAT